LTNEERNAIVVANLGVIRLMVRDVCKRDDDDMFQLACVRAIEAIDGFDASKRSLLSWLRYTIKGGIRQHQKEWPNSAGIRVPIATYYRNTRTAIANRERAASLKRLGQFNLDERFYYCDPDPPRYVE
jgi:DNA-directed RNA polymerase specialized sigma subunit